MRVTNERVKELMQSNTVTISSIADIRDLCTDLLEARELIDKQEAIIKEMREELREVLVSREHGEAKEMVFITNFTDIEAILERTKEYAWVAFLRYLSTFTDVLHHNSLIVTVQVLCYVLSITRTYNRQLSAIRNTGISRFLPFSFIICIYHLYSVFFSMTRFT